MRFLLVAAMCLGAAAAVRADRASDLARIHLEAIGGRERVAALTALRATGQVTAGKRQVRFTLVAARPDRVRLETEAGVRMLVQGYDGAEPPWEFDTGTWPPKYRDMAESVAKTFVADAEFDDPLIAGEARGYTFDYAGEVETEKRKLLRLLVTRKFTDTFSLLLDPQTFFIVMRAEDRTTAAGRKTQVVTYYDDFRPVGGVLLPHKITVTTEGRIMQETKILRIEANPTLNEDTFSRPKVVLPGAPPRL